MTVSIRFIEGLACPFFVCDACQRPIKNDSTAMVAWDAAGEPHVVMAHVHKGHCLDGFERGLSSPTNLRTEELYIHIEQLTANSCAAAPSRDRRGPMARFKEVVEDPATLGVIVQRVADGESVSHIAGAWAIPRKRLREWLIQEGRRLVRQGPSSERRDASPRDEI